MRVGRLFLLYLCLGLVATVQAAVDDEALAQLLVRKGVLSPHELRTMQRDASFQRSAHPYQKNVPQAPQTSLPSWVSKMKWSGDVRMRYESLKRSTVPTTTPDRHRFKIRSRFGFTAKVNDNIEAGVRMVTGADGNPTSTDETLSDAFDHKDLGIDRAYIKYLPSDAATFMFGKFANPFFSTDLVFDSDLAFDGFAQVFTYQTEYADYYIVTGQFPVDENSDDNNDPWLFAGQVGAVFDPFSDVEIEVGFANYRYTDMLNRLPLGIAFGSTSRFGASLSDEFRYLHAYNLYNLTSQVNFFMNNVPMCFVGDYVKNTDTVDPETGKYDTGYQLGVHVGKAKAPKTLEAFLYYRKLEANATLDVFTDSDFGGGGTNHKGFKTGLKYQLMENTKLALTYINAELIEKEGLMTEEDAKTIQIDMSVKF